MAHEAFGAWSVLIAVLPWQHSVYIVNNWYSQVVLRFISVIPVFLLGGEHVFYFINCDCRHSTPFYWYKLYIMTRFLSGATIGCILFIWTTFYFKDVQTMLTDPYIDFQIDNLKQVLRSRLAKTISSTNSSLVNSLDSRRKLITLYRQKLHEMQEIKEADQEDNIMTSHRECFSVPIEVEPRGKIYMSHCLELRYLHCVE